MLYRMTTSAPIFGLRREIDRLFEDTFAREGGSFTPAVDIKENEDDRYQIVERTYGTFLRTFQLPQGVNEDLIKGEFEHGVLSISIPKAALPQPKRIHIGGAQQKEQATVGSGNVSNQQSTGKTSGKNSTTTSQRERDSEKMAAASR